MLQGKLCTKANSNLAVPFTAERTMYISYTLK